MEVFAEDGLWGFMGRDMEPFVGPPDREQAELLLALEEVWRGCIQDMSLLH
jgi:hypothetical protein